MGIISWIFFGLVVGALARFFMPGKDPGGFIVTTLLGIGGAVLAGFLGQVFGWGKVNSFDLWGIFISTIGAILVLVVYRQVRKSRSGTK